MANGIWPEHWSTDNVLMCTGLWQVDKKNARTHASMEGSKNRSVRQTLTTMIICFTRWRQITSQIISLFWSKRYLCTLCLTDTFSTVIQHQWLTFSWLQRVSCSDFMRNKSTMTRSNMISLITNIALKLRIQRSIPKSASVKHWFKLINTHGFKCGFRQNLKC